MTQQAKSAICRLVIAAFLAPAWATFVLADSTHLPVTAPIDTDSAGRGGVQAFQSVVRIICKEHNTVGTGFLHKSGNLITAAHVVAGCVPIIALSSGAVMKATIKAIDADVDVALLQPEKPIEAAALSVTSKKGFSVGIPISTWGYPGGYFGKAPMLAMGYLAGVDAFRLRDNDPKIVTRWVVNAAFNGGNSGGPVLEVETGDVIGVVSSKLAPLTPFAISVLKALESQQSGFTYEAVLPNGEKKSFSEGQLVGEVLGELRSQIQLVIGYAVPTDDLRTFLKSNGVEP